MRRLRAERLEVVANQLVEGVAVAMTVFGGVFLLVLLIFWMTYKILQTIEIGARHP